ncbi:unnamed protein product [Spirodela intermedia]|uniref:AT3G52170-like helix-turn-helix domain-containing protein n=1 Tax=Spirodela intermedia TaxID=51605 RepID=A0A7I8LMJ6_SPIIN|nr:unnamed protein product [Spirodela intermedia]
MQVGRVSCVGQTFALARCSDSQGKKHRSRVTKEERRKMVESFIRRHRTSNNGNFPSLNLTHKEVGGSFYTVREIVREIIQENRVLRPGNLNSHSVVLNDSEEKGPEPFSENTCNLPLITVDPSSMHRWEGASDSNPNENANGVLSTVSLIFSDQHISNSIKENFALSSTDILLARVTNEVSAQHQEHCLEKACGHVDSANEKSKEELIERAGQRQNFFPKLHDEESLLEAELDKEGIHSKCEVGNDIGLNELLVVNPISGASVAEVSRNYILGDDVKVRFSSEEGENSREGGFVFDKPEKQASLSHDEVSCSINAEVYYPSQSGDSTICVPEHAFLKSAGVSDISKTQVDDLFSAKGSTMQVDSETTVDSAEGLLSPLLSSSDVIGQKNAESTEVPTSNDAWYPNSCECIKQVMLIQYFSLCTRRSLSGVLEKISSNSYCFLNIREGYSRLSLGIMGQSPQQKPGSQTQNTSTQVESSEAEQKKHSEANSLWVIIKGFATAFIKFWIE